MLAAAVVGTGFMGPTHVEALRRLGIHITGILGISPERSAEAARQLGLPLGYSDYQAVLDDPAVQVVHITTPNRLHLDMSRRALLAGKHVICEKPLAMDSRETAELLEVARSRPNQVAVVHFNIRFYPAVLQAREIVQSGAIGDVYAVHGGYFQDWLLYDTDWNWRLVEEEGGKLRAIADIGSHWMDTVSFISGLNVSALLAELHTFLPRRKMPRQAVATFKGKEQAAPTEYDEVEIRTEDWGAVLFRYAGNARGNMTVSQVNAGRKNRMFFEIAGSKGAVSWDGEHVNDLWVGWRDRGNELITKDPALLTGAARHHASYPGGHAEGYPDTFKQLYRAVYDYIAAGDYERPRPFPTFEDGHRAAVLADAILESHNTQQWIDIP